MQDNAKVKEETDSSQVGWSPFATVQGVTALSGVCHLDRAGET